MKLVATLSHLFRTLGSSPASSLGAQTSVFPGPPHGGAFLLSYHVPSVSPPKGCVFRRGSGEGDCDSFISVMLQWCGIRHWVGQLEEVGAVLDRSETPYSPTTHRR